MEVQVTDSGNLEILVDKWDMFVNLLAMGFSIALVIVVVVAAIRMGWKLWPWILVAGLVAWLMI